MKDPCCLQPIPKKQCSNMLFLSCGMLLLLAAPLASAAGSRRHTTGFVGGFQNQRLKNTLLSSSQEWAELEDALGAPFRTPSTAVSIDSVLDPSKPTFSTERPTLFRERHGWCPYSERVWLTLELGDVPHDTIRIDNTGGPRPSYYGGLTPQMQWPDGKTQGESMDLVNALDERYDLGFQSQDANVGACISQFRNIFPSARPSSRAAFLFQNNGSPLGRSTFEKTLQETDDLLSKTEGPFFCGTSITTADIAWAPFLERYRYQLPCLHEGLKPFDMNVYPKLAAWYQAMDQEPAYACRVKGDASSWRKVLTMAGFGNAGVPTAVATNMDELAAAETAAAASAIDLNVWIEYASTRPYVAASPQKDAASTIVRNREAIVRDTVKRASAAPWQDRGLPKTGEEVDSALRKLVHVLLNDGDYVAPSTHVGTLAGFLDERMCVPRDMGAMSAACLKKVAFDLQGN